MLGQNLFLLCLILLKSANPIAIVCEELSELFFPFPPISFI